MAGPGATYGQHVDPLCQAAASRSGGERHPCWITRSPVTSPLWVWHSQTARQCQTHTRTVHLSGTVAVGTGMSLTATRSYTFPLPMAGPPGMPRERGHRLPEWRGRTRQARRLAIDGTGALLIADDAGNTVWRVAAADGSVTPQLSPLMGDGSVARQRSTAGRNYSTGTGDRQCEPNWHYTLNPRRPTLHQQWGRMMGATASNGRLTAARWCPSQ